MSVSYKFRREKNRFGGGYSFTNLPPTVLLALLRYLSLLVPGRKGGEGGGANLMQIKLSTLIFYINFLCN